MTADADTRHLLELMVARSASDFHIAAGSPPRLRVDGALIPVVDVERCATSRRSPPPSAWPSAPPPLS